MTSKGYYGRKPMDIELRARELADPGHGQAIVKVRACGVCGTDANFVRDWTGAHMALGHEIAGEVVEVGPGVSRVSPGDHVIVEDCTMCGTCDNCKTGHPELCRSMFSLDGQPGMGEYLLVSHNSLVRFSGLDFTTASLTEPLAVSLTSVLNADIPLGGSVLVLGNGPLGLMSALLARIRGAGFVAIASRGRAESASGGAKSASGGATPLQAARLAASQKAGLDMVITSGSEPLLDCLKERLLPRFPAGMDRVIVSSPPASLRDAIAIARFGGIITFYGLHLGGAESAGDRGAESAGDHRPNVVPIDVNDLVFRKITLVPTFAEPAINFPLSLSLLREGRIDPRLVITHTFGLDDVPSVMAGILEGTLPAVKAVLVT